MFSKALATLCAGLLLYATGAEAQTYYPPPPASGGGSGTVTSVACPSATITTSGTCAPLAAAGTSGDVITASGTNQIGDSGILASSLAPLASPTFTGTLTTPAETISGITGSTQCLQVNTSGVVAGAGTSCGGGFSFPAPISNNWYMPPFSTFVAGTAALTTATIYCQAQFIPFTITIKTMAIRVTTLASGGNAQIALYANSAGRPSGTALGSTGSLSTTTATNVTAAPSAGNFTVSPGVYWACINTDATAGGTAEFQSYANASPITASFIGSATIANVNNSATAQTLKISTPGTFGTWPNLSSGPPTWTEVTTQPAPVILLQSN